MSASTLPWFTLAPRPRALVAIALNTAVENRLSGDGTLAAVEKRGWGPIVSNSLVLAHTAEAIGPALTDMRVSASAAPAGSPADRRAARRAVSCGLRTTCHLFVYGWVALRGIQVQYPCVTVSALVRAALFVKGEDAVYLLSDCDHETRSDLYDDMLAALPDEERANCVRVVEEAASAAWRGRRIAGA